MYVTVPQLYELSFRINSPARAYLCVCSRNLLPVAYLRNPSEVSGEKYDPTRMQTHSSNMISI